ncbi:MFS transporter [Amycolatopsis keratiniphila]|uniref:Putative proline/betaine transporter n=1 Tax=Amycolatopsis keratiniphila subsp. keratiniphila TaxID=227715 RepID=A0A1W2LRP2_9PSEU|nr:MFS transporter [Amycolatopsis keratiniphila]OLZ56294.1 MFS transporter [Amycolatopsis keratiniphila subsp. nogabecina]ONF67001.1 MFS transporter [Amycolatopsis keratiniphila subsp. keratiniphila]SDU53100.1 MFS transporter, MHS family, proline/betaine transporter [Amycolatopsis keratiniphila]
MAEEALSASHQEKGAPTEAPPEQIRKAVAGAAMGNCIEWYDFGVFGFMPAILGQVFFNASSTSEGALATFAVLAITFVVRPFGSFVFGPLGDKIGRQKVLALTIILMSGSTFIIGLLPSYATIGPAAAVLLILLRTIQGFSAGGEYGGAATFIAEYAPARRRGFWGSWLEFGTLVGFAMGAGFVTIFTVVLGDEAMREWGWRLPFLIAGPLGIVGLYLRNKLEDTPLFQEIEKKNQVEKSPLKALLKKHWTSILHLIGIVVMLNVADYIVITYLETYLKDVVGFSGHTPLLIILATIGLMLILIVPVGMLSDRIGRKPILITCCASFLVLPIPAFSLMGAAADDRNAWQLMLGLVMIAVPLVLILAVLAATLPAMFPTQERYSGFSIGYSVSTAAFGGTASYIIGSLVNSTGDNLWPAYYLMGAAAIAAIPILLLPETAGVSLRGIVNSRIARRRKPETATPGGASELPAS